MATQFIHAPDHRYSFSFYPLAARSVADGVTASSTTVTSATAAFSSLDVGATIVGTGIPALATIASVTNATTVVISAAATATATGVALTITRTNALALQAFQNAYQADISYLASVPAFAAPAAPTVAVIVDPNTQQAYKVSPGQWFGFNYGNYQTLSTSFMGRVVTDLVTTSSSTTVTSATAAFSSSDVGGYLATPNLPIASTIVSVTNSTTVVVSSAALASGSAQTATLTPPVALFTPDWV